MQNQSADITEQEIRQKIGFILPKFKLTSARKKRISDLLRSDCLPRQILFTYAQKTDCYREGFAKIKQIDGFRKGKGPYHKQAIPKVLDDLMNPSSPDSMLCWMIYQASATKYVQTELPLLDKLLAEVTYDGDDTDSGELLRAICLSAIDYEVTAADVAKLYEVWWLDRVENVDKILSLCGQQDESRIQARAIRKLSLFLDDLKISIDALNQKLTTQSTKLTHSDTISEKNSQKLSDHYHSLTALQEQLTNLSKRVSDSANSNVDFERRLNKLSETLIQLRQQVQERATIEGLKAQMKDLRAELKVSIDNASETQFAIFKQQTFEAMDARIQEVDQKLTDFSADIETRVARTDGYNSSPTTNRRYESPLSPSLGESRLAAKPAQELDFVMSWSRTLSDLGFSFSDDTLLAHHSILLASNVTVTSHRLSKSWIDSLGWTSFQKHIVATPTWSTEEDWASGVEHLFSNRASREPRVLFIHNYDIGIVECYLAPTLLHWAVSEARNGMLTKIFLIPSIEALLPSFQILDHAAYLLPKSSGDASSLFLIDGLAAGLKSTKKLSSAVDPKSVLQWLASTAQCDFDLTPIQNSFDLELSDWLVQNFRKTVSVAQKFFQEDSAVGIGMYHHIIPWVRSRYKESDQGGLDAYLKQLLNVRY